MIKNIQFIHYFFSFMFQNAGNTLKEYTLQSNFYFLRTIILQPDDLNHRNFKSKLRLTDLVGGGIVQRQH